MTLPTFPPALPWVSLPDDPGVARQAICVEQGGAIPPIDGAAVDASRFAETSGFTGKSGQLLLIPASDGSVAGALCGLGRDPHPMEVGRLARALPEGLWRLGGALADPHAAALGFLLGAYRFESWRKPGPAGPRLALDPGLDRARLLREAGALIHARELINAPPNELGPDELAAAVVALGEAHGAHGRIVEGRELADGFPMVHAVGRASSRGPKLAEFTWGEEGAPRIALVGKGVCFDSGGLNLKPGDSMTLMKKDMGGAAGVLALAALVMGARLPVRLHVVVAAVENAISGDAFRPGDILRSRKGITVEIGNTDAEGRLILADALAFADEHEPDLILDMATLTGAARVALGPDLPAFYCNDDGFADEVLARSRAVADPLWRMPLWQPYAKGLSSEAADISHIGKGPMGGSITAALFLEKFVEQAKVWAHVDLYAWTTTERPWARIGGDAQGVRALFAALAGRYGGEPAA